MIILMLRMIRMIILMLRMIILMGQDDGSWFMAHGSRLMAHGSWPRGASPALEPGGAPGPDPDVWRSTYNYDPNLRFQISGAGFSEKR